jgi:hypothetical protein
MRAFAHFLDDFAHEGLEISGITARDEALIRHHRLIAPLASGIGHVGLDGVEGRALLALDDARFYKQPRSMADRSDDLARRVEGPDDLDGFRLRPQLVGIDLAAGQNERIVGRRIDAFDILVDLDALAPILLVLAANFVRVHA